MPSSCCVNRTAQLGAFSKLAEGALSSTTDVLKSTGSKKDPWGIPLIASLHLEHPLSVAFQPIPYPPGGPPIKSTSIQFGDKDVVGDHVKGLAQVQVNYINRLPFVHQCHHSIIEGHQIG